MPKPIIGIVAGTSWVNTSGPLSFRHVTAMTNANIEPIIDADGIAVLVPNLIPEEGLATLVGRLDGILFPGGPDIDPANYGQKQRVDYSDKVMSTGEPYFRPRMMEPVPRRDKFELAVYAEAKRRNKPVLGVCRGMQLINVAEGGTLHQEVADVALLKHEIDHSGYNHHHELIIEEGTLFHEIFESKSCFGPSTHHQSVDRLGKNLIVSGRSSDGVVELIEHEDRSIFIIGTQGDIERARMNIPGFGRVYSRFVDECRLRMTKNH